MYIKEILSDNKKQKKRKTCGQYSIINNSVTNINESIRKIAELSSEAYLSIVFYSEFFRIY